MTCSDFVERFTDFLDGEGSDAFRLEADEHLASCPQCRRYRDVMTRAADLLRALPQETVPEDFGPRLQHRLYRVDEEVTLSAHKGSGATVFTVLGMSLLLTALAWSPVLRPAAPVVELPPLVVSQRPSAMRPVNALPMRTPLPRPAFRLSDTGLWDDAQGLLYEYSPLQQRYRERSPLRRAGLD